MGESVAQRVSGGKIRTVLVCDDHPIVRSGVRLILATAPEFRLVAEAGNGVETLTALARFQPDLLILDLWMGGQDGLELIRQTMARLPSARILVYSVNDERIFGPRAIKAGAAGYLMKLRTLDELLAALRIIADGRRYLSPELSNQLADAALHTGRERSDRSDGDLEILTDRELEVFRLVGRGNASAAIARTLGISARTVGAHRENIKNKLKLPDAAALSQRAVSLLENHRL